jgi:hypothetical protein
MDKIKTDLNRLRMKVVDPDITRNLTKILEIYDEDQLEFMLYQPGGLILNEKVKLNYYRGVGYMCRTLRNEVLPLCIIVERNLNGKPNIEVV